MVNFIQAANDKIKITEDVSYLLNDALHVNTVFTANGAVTAGEPVLRINLPNIGDHAELNWYNTAADYAATAAAKVKNLITEMSHDLRTPLTTLLLYTEILRGHKYDSEAQMNDYLTKIDTKARQTTTCAASVLSASIET